MLSAVLCAWDSRRRPQSFDGGKLASLRLDTPFKRAFNKPETLSHFLNAVLNDDAEHRVTAINNVEVKSAITRFIIFDVHCTLANGSKVVIELQKANMRTQLFDRLVGYLGNAYSQQWHRSGKTEAGTGYSLVPVRMVAVIDFTVADTREDTPATHSSLVANVSACLRFGKLPAAAVARLRELLDITVVQLPLAPTSVKSSMPAAELWAHLLRHSQEYTVSTLPEALRAEPYVSAAVSARVDAMSAAERAALEVEENHVRDTVHSAAELEAATQRAEQEKQRAEQEKQRAEQEKQRAEQEKQRADALAQRLAEMLRDGAGAGAGAGAPGGGKRRT
jgi:hypothetical protein